MLPQIASILAVSTGHPAASWVRDERALVDLPLWTCPLLFDSRNDEKMAVAGRGGMCDNTSSMRWHAKLSSPQGVDIPSSAFAASSALDGKVLVMIGDSLGGDQYHDLLCSLHRQPAVNVIMVQKNRQDPTLPGILIAEVQAATATFWAVFTSVTTLRPKRQATSASPNAVGAEQLEWTQRAIAKVELRIPESPYRGVALRGVIIQLTSVKAHSLNARGYEGHVSKYFEDVASFIIRSQAAIGWELLYYRPSFATHFATATAGYMPGADESVEQCKAIDANTDTTAQRSWFNREEKELLQRTVGRRFSSDALTATVSRVVVIPHAWDLSVDMWFQHPGLTHAAHNLSRPVTDCLHFCVLGDGYFGLYEANNRWWFWDMLQKLEQLPSKGNWSLPVATKRAGTGILGRLG